MLFNSVEFAVFLPIALVLYWLSVRSVRMQNAILVVASYVFYGWWDWRFLTLIVASTLLDYTVGRLLGAAESPRRRRLLLGLSVVGNLSMLGVFKYFDFFAESAARVLGAFGIGADVGTLGIVLPVGISFYTFQTMSYTIDIYRRKQEPVRDPVTVAAYVAFFPQLVAGPIERASRLMPQMTRPRSIDPGRFEAGLWLVVFGYLKKCLVADNLAIVVERAYEGGVDPALAALGTLAFAFQIYADFSGYSDIARGVAKWFGFDLMVNFRAPYLARNIQEFWHRWHISLSTWLRDYLYIPLGGNRKGPVRTYVNLMLTMLLGGLWHGAAWHFVAWGGWHGAMLAAHRLVAGRSGNEAGWRRSVWWSCLSWLATFLAVLVSWVLFRARSMAHAGEILGLLAAGGGSPSVSLGVLAGTILLIAPVVALDLWQERTRSQVPAAALPLVARAALAGLLIALVAAFGSFTVQEFIYFQF